MTFPNAIYAASINGPKTLTFALFIFQDGILTGADAGSAVYDGEYHLTEDGQKIIGKVTMPFGVFGETVHFIFPVNFDPHTAYPVETLNGKVNVQFRRLRTL